MGVPLNVDAKNRYLLSTEKMRSMVGGTLTTGLIRIVVFGVSYFYHTGIKEGRRMRNLL